MSKKKRNGIFLVVILAAALAIIIYLLATAGEISTDDAAIESDVVPVSAKISGYVKDLKVADNQQVKAGDVILEIDPVDYQLAFDAASASLDAARAKLEGSSSQLKTTKVSGSSDIASATAQVEAATANWQNAKADLARYTSLPKGAVSRQQVDIATAAEKSARANVDDAEAKLKSAHTAPNTVQIASSNVKQLEAEVKQAEANLATAQENLKNTKIVAPFDGRITKRGVELGAYVEPGEQLLAVVSNNYWVVANYKETQVTDMRPGQPVSIEIDAFPGKNYAGKIDSVQIGTGARFSTFPPENATGNFVKIIQRVPVKIVFTERPDPALAIGPGMSVVPVVSVK